MQLVNYSAFSEPSSKNNQHRNKACQFAGLGQRRASFESSFDAEMNFLGIFRKKI